MDMGIGRQDLLQGEEVQGDDIGNAFGLARTRGMECRGHANDDSMGDNMVPGVLAVASRRAIW